MGERVASYCRHMSPQKGLDTYGEKGLRPSPPYISRRYSMRALQTQGPSIAPEDLDIDNYPAFHIIDEQPS